MNNTAMLIMGVIVIVGLFVVLTSNNKHREPLFQEEDMTQEEYDLYMQGFRAGCPVRDNEQGTIEDANEMPWSDYPQFQRGYAEGKKAYKQFPASIQGIARESE